MSVDEILELGFTDVNNIKNHYGEEIKNGLMTKSLSKGRECDINGN